MKILPIYKIFFDKKFLQNLDKENKIHFKTMETHFGYANKQGDHYILTTASHSKNIQLINLPLKLIPYKVSDRNILNESVPQFVNSPGYSWDQILDYNQIKVFFDKNPNNIVEKIEVYLEKNESNIYAITNQIREIEGIIIIDKNTTELKHVYNFKKIKNH
jgi:hypothetical protein